MSLLVGLSIVRFNRRSDEKTEPLDAPTETVRKLEADAHRLRLVDSCSTNPGIRIAQRASQHFLVAAAT